MLDYLFKKIDVHLCPEVKGRITDDGKPVEGLKVLRQLAFNEFDAINDTAVTDDNGEFYFPEKQLKIPKRNISFQANTTWQLIEVYFSNKEKSVLWDVTHKGINRNNKFNNKLSSLNCDINDEEVIFDFGRDLSRDYCPYFGITKCRWQEDFKIRRLNN